MTTTVDRLESTITTMLTGRGRLHAPTFTDAVVDAQLAPTTASIIAGDDDSTPCLAFITLPQSDRRKVDRLQHWIPLLPGRPCMFRGQLHRTADRIRLHVRSAVKGRLVIVAADFSRRDEPATVAAINTGIDCLGPTVLLANLARLERDEPPHRSASEHA